MKEDHLNDVVRIHETSFKDFFLTSLGGQFLDLYYRRVVNYNEAIKLVYGEENNGVEGFVVGVPSAPAFYRSLLKRDWFKFSVYSARAILKNPRSVFRIIYSVFSRIITEVDSSAMIELSSLAVLPVAQGKGIAKELVRAFIDEAKKRALEVIYLTTDANQNEAANSFYQKNGFKIKRVFEAPGKRVMNEYWIRLVDKDDKHV